MAGSRSVYHGRARVREARRAAHKGQGCAFVKVGLAVLDSGFFVNYTSHARVSMPSVLAPADSPSEDQFTLASIAVELETNLCSAFDDAADEPASDADVQHAAGGACAGAP